MKVVVAFEDGVFRAWVKDDAPVNAQMVELPGVRSVIGYADRTVKRLRWPQEIAVAWQYGTNIFPREVVEFRGIEVSENPRLNDVTTLEGE